MQHIMMNDYSMSKNPTAQFSPSGNRQACLLGAGQTVLIATQNSPKSGE